MNGKRAVLLAIWSLWFQAEISSAKDGRLVQPEQTPADAAPKAQAHGQGLLGDLRFGPSVALGIPHPISASFDIVYADLISLSISGGNSSIKYQRTDFKFHNWDLGLRLHPFAGSFFIGADYGRQDLFGQTTVFVPIRFGDFFLQIPATMSLEVESSYLTPKLGWLIRWDSGFTLGFDIGYQMNSNLKSQLNSSFENIPREIQQIVYESDEYRQAKVEVENTAMNVFKAGIPYVTFLRLGYLF